MYISLTIIQKVCLTWFLYEKRTYIHFKEHKFLKKFIWSHLNAKCSFKIFETYHKKYLLKILLWAIFSCISYEYSFQVKFKSVTFACVVSAYIFPVCVLFIYTLNHFGLYWSVFIKNIPKKLHGMKQKFHLKAIDLLSHWVAIK